jgi:hypothetical protein
MRWPSAVITVSVGSLPAANSAKLRFLPPVVLVAAMMSGLHTMAYPGFQRDTATNADRRFGLLRRVFPVSTSVAI